MPPSPKPTFGRADARLYPLEATAVNTNIGLANATFLQLEAAAVGQLISTRRLLAFGREPSTNVSGHEQSETP